MSTHLNSLAAPGAAADAGVSAATNTLGEVLRRLVAAWHEAMALRRNLSEISQLSDRELTDIGLAPDEIHRLRASDVFTPRRWQDGRAAQGDSPL